MTNVLGLVGSCNFREVLFIQKSIHKAPFSYSFAQNSVTGSTQYGVGKFVYKNIEFIG